MVIKKLVDENLGFSAYLEVYSKEPDENSSVLSRFEIFNEVLDKDSGFVKSLEASNYKEPIVSCKISYNISDKESFGKNQDIILRELINYFTSSYVELGLDQGVLEIFPEDVFSECIEYMIDEITEYSTST